MASGTLGNLSVDLLLETVQWAAGLNKAEYQAQQFADKIEQKFNAMGSKIGESLKGALVGLAAGFAVDRIVGFVNETQKAADAMDELAQKSGTSAGFMAEMSVMAGTSGTSIEALAQGMVKFNKATVEAFSDPTSQPAKVFEALGISLKDSNGVMKTSEALYREASNAMGNMTDSATKTAAATILWGKSGADLIPMMNAQARASDEMKEATKAYGDEIVRLVPVAGALEEQQAIMSTNSKTFAAILGQQLIPYITTLIKQWNDLSSAGSGLSTVGTALLNAFKGIVIAVDAIVTTFKDLITIVIAAVSAFAKLRSGDVAGALATYDEAMKDLSDSSKGFNDRLKALIDPMSTLSTSTHKTTDATDKLTKAVGGAKDGAAEAAKEWDRLSKAWVKSIDEEIAAEKKMAEASAKAIAERVAAEEKAAEEIFKIRMQALDAEQRIQAEADAATQRYYRDQGERNTRELEAQFGGMFKGIEEAGRAAFDAMFDKTSGGWDGMLETMATSFKRILLDMIYQSFAKPLVLNLLAQMPGGIGQMASTALGNMPGGGGGIDWAATGSSIATSIGGFFGAGEGMMASLGSLGSTIGAAMPYIGAAMLAISVIKGLQKPSLPQAALSFGGGAMEDNVSVTGAFGRLGFDDSRTKYFSGEAGKAALNVINNMLSAVSSAFSPERVAEITKRLQGHTFSGMKGTDILSSDLPAMLKEVFGVVFEDIGGVWQEKIASFSGTTEEFVALIGQFVQYTDLLKEVDFAALAEDAAPKTMMEAYQAQRGALNEYIAGMDDSAESMAGLTQGMGAFQQATVQMILAIDAAASAIHEMFMSTAESIRMSVMTTEEQYNYLQQSTEELWKQLESSTDPAEIQRLAEQINRNITQAWGLLTEEQRAELAPDFLKQIERIDATVAERMSALREVVIEDADTMMETVANRLEAIFGTASAAANTQMDAANTNLAAAQTPVTVIVEVEGGGNSVTTGD
jgi:hypothetical protein